MSRMAQSRGGPRNGTPGTAYPNRTDLQAPPTQPIAAAPNQPYGQAGAQIAAQQAVPLPQGQTAGVQPPVLGLNAPSQRPGEHVMTGSPQGPGAGPEVLPSPQRNFAPAPGPLTPRDRLQAMLQAGLASGQQLDDLAMLVNQLGR